MEFTERALVLKSGRFREIDLWLRLLVPGHGVISAFAFGGSKSRRRFCGCLDPLCLTSFHVKSSRCGNYLQLMEGALLEGFPRVRSDLARLGIAVNCLKFVEAIHVDADDSRQVFDLLVETLEVLEAEPGLPEHFPLFFRAKLTFGQGLSPGFETCLECDQRIRNSASRLFVVSRGGVVCEQCRAPGQVCLPMDAASTEILNTLESSGPRHWRDIDPPRGTGHCLEIVDQFIDYHLGLRWSKGRFQKH